MLLQIKFIAVSVWRSLNNYISYHFPILFIALFSLLFSPFQGPVGSKGRRGPPGYEGPRGPIGDAGPMGKAGSAGQRGQDGARGRVGQRGQDGDQGPVGALGKPGMEGQPVSLKLVQLLQYKC